MAYDERTAERVRRVLAGQRGLAERKMMGGLCFMVNGSMCCGVSGSALMVRVGREASQQMVTQPHVRPMEFTGRRLAGFVLVDPEGYRTDAALATWVRRGVDFIAKLPSEKFAEKVPTRSARR